MYHRLQGKRQHIISALFVTGCRRLQLYLKGKAPAARTVLPIFPRSIEEGWYMSNQHWVFETYELFISFLTHISYDSLLTEDSVSLSIDFSGVSPGQFSLGLALLHKPGGVTGDITSVILFPFKIRTEHNKSNNCIDFDCMFVCYQILTEVRKNF